ncbi:MAG TPA: peptidoglycan editing factor PgeF, partial [Tepidisphaeraceae bacterium]|nr:peptidoglycan editing factor PgeF [Tepidisphaeraceae bacterium]
LGRRIADNGVVFYASPLLERIGVPHAFSTRIGGVSAGIFSSLNLGNPSGTVLDSSDHIAENYRRLMEAAGCEGKVKRSVFQVHGADVVWMNRETNCVQQPAADAIACDDPRCVACVRMADCVPVLLAGSDGKIVAAVHAGWRGVVAGVVSAAIAALRRRIQPGREILAAIGPSIGAGNFEVGMEVVEEFRRVFGTDAPAQLRCGGKAHVDLRAAIGLQLHKCGVDADHIDSTDRCTFRDKDEFFSHRRERGVSGRMAAIIAPRA